MLPNSHWQCTAVEVNTLQHAAGCQGCERCCRSVALLKDGMWQALCKVQVCQLLQVSQLGQQIANCSCTTK